MATRVNPRTISQQYFTAADQFEQACRSAVRKKQHGPLSHADQQRFTSAMQSYMAACNTAQRSLTGRALQLVETYNTKLGKRINRMLQTAVPSTAPSSRQTPAHAPRQTASRTPSAPARRPSARTPAPHHQHAAPRSRTTDSARSHSATAASRQRAEPLSTTLQRLNLAIHEDQPLEARFRLFSRLDQRLQRDIYEELYQESDDPGNGAVDVGINLFFNNPRLLITPKPQLHGRTILDKIIAQQQEREQAAQSTATHSRRGPSIARSSASRSTPRATASSHTARSAPHRRTSHGPQQTTADVQQATDKLSQILRRKGDEGFGNAAPLFFFLTRNINDSYQPQFGDYGIESAFGPLSFNPASPGDAQFLRSLQGTRYFAGAMRALAASQFNGFLQSQARITGTQIAVMLQTNWRGSRDAVYRLLKEVIKYCIIRDNTPHTTWDHYHSYTDALAHNAVTEFAARRSASTASSRTSHARSTHQTTPSHRATTARHVTTHQAHDRSARHAPRSTRQATAAVSRVPSSTPRAVHGPARGHATSFQPTRPSSRHYAGGAEARDG